ncbi:radical SAM protein [Pedobacter sp. KACC 23697]|uniref:Radical SAM protein n=1 Tax=Pedobacter sp. KACC 23697 TaxID=3149230 RepID=A0AAU7KAB3_9SPHI
MTDILIRKTQKGRSLNLSQLLDGHSGAVIEYSIDDHAGQTIAQHLSQSSAANVLFIDDVVLSGLKDITTIMGFSPSKNTAYNLSGPGTDFIFGNDENEGRDSAVTSCCYLVPAESLAAETNTAYKTTEFFLIANGRKNEFQSKRMNLNGFNFDGREWAGNRILNSAEALAADYETLLAREGEEIKSAVPSQFRIKTNHYFARVKLPADGDQAFDGPKFSIICPVFKSAFVEQMINSVMAQVWPNWELLIAVDGPPQAELEKIAMVLSKISDPRVSYYIQANQGTGPTRRDLAVQATGDFIFPIDDDDMLVPDSLRCFAGAVSANPETFVFRGNTQIIGLIEHSLQARKRYLIDGISNDTFEVNQPYIIQKKLLHQLGGYVADSSLRNAGEDTLLFHHIDQAGAKVGMINAPLYLRRLSTQNLTLEFKIEEAMGHFKNIDQRFTPGGWEIKDRKFGLDGNFQTAMAAYTHAAQKREVITANKFFQYQTMSDVNKLVIDLEVTSRCNATCGFCPRSVMPDVKSFIAVSTVENLANNIKNGPQRLVVLCGIGESLLHPQIERIVEILTAANAYVAMTSNGALMNENIFRQLVKAGLKSVNFSVNAATGSTHELVMGMKNFHKVKANIERALEIKEELNADIKVNVSFVVCEQNEHEVDQFVENWKGSSATQIWLHPVNNRAGLLGAGMKSVKMDSFFTTYAGDQRVVVDVFRDHDETDNLCKIAKNLAFISADGTMRLCAMDYQRVTAHGNINSTTLQQLQFDKLSGFIKGDYDTLCGNCDFCPSELKKQIALR